MNDQFLKELKEQTKWLRFLALPNVRKVVEENLTTKEQRLIYDLSNGENSAIHISKNLEAHKMKVSDQTVYNYWKKWFALGIVVSSEKRQGRFEKIFELKDLNI